MVERQVREVNTRGGPKFTGLNNPVNPASQFISLLHRMLLDSFRDIGAFWLRLVVDVTVCIALGTIFFQLTKSWSEAAARGGLIFFTFSFLTFMSMSGLPVFVDNMKIFTRERLNGYYGVFVYALANTISSMPFLAIMAVLCTLVVYYLAGLNSDSDRVLYFMFNLWACLMAVR